MAEILLINPTINVKKRYGLYHIFAPLEIPMGLAYLASFLTKEGHKVYILDNQIEEVTTQILRKYLNKNLLIIGITSMSPSFENACKIASLIKKLKPSSKIVFGGIHPTLMVEEVLYKPFIDIVVRGEGEITLAQLVRALEKRESLDGIQGISYKKGDLIVHNPDRPYITNLGQLPFPERDAFSLDRYRPPLDMVKRFPTELMITSRGCPYQCIYCASRAVSGYQYRVTPEEKVVEEIESLISKYKAKDVIFLDDNFTFDRDRTLNLCRIFIEHEIHRRINWFCCVRVDNIDPYLLKKMAQAGCWMITYGLETGVQSSLDLIKKGISLQQSQKAVRWTKEAGIKCRATFMLGLPAEGKKEAMKTISFAKSLKLYRVKFSLATPYPGTEIFRQTKDSLFCDWTRYDTMAGFTSYKSVVAFDKHKVEELSFLQRKTMIHFYLRPKNIMSIFVLFFKFFIYKNIRYWLHFPFKRWQWLLFIENIFRH